MLTLRAYPSWFTFFARALGSCLLMLNTALVSATTLQSIAVKDLPDRTSIFLTLNGLPAYRFFVLQAPLRAVIDFPQTNVNFKINQVSFGHGVIGHMRSGNPNPSTLRIVFDLNHAIDMRVVNWKSGMNGAQGLRVDLVSKEGGVHPSYRERPPLLKPVTRPIALAIPRSIAVPHAIAVHHAPPKSLRDVVVVIDAGHGGKDPGAIGPRRNVEKNVVLGIALKLKQRIDREPGMRAVMTRQGDYYIGLRERLKMARKYNADMFVSIHADAFNNKESNGAS